jgi:predicted RNase H-like nuclease (RuvC/YqgF family)
MANEETVKQEQQNAEVEQKTFTQDEVNSIVAERLNRDRQKYADYDAMKQKAEEFDKLQEANKTELEKANDRAKALEQELETLKKVQTVQAARAKVSSSTGVPVELLTAETEEECEAQAKAILAFKTPQNYPIVNDGGEVGGNMKTSTRSQFAEWFNNQAE